MNIKKKVDWKDYSTKLWFHRYCELYLSDSQKLSKFIWTFFVVLAVLVSCTIMFGYVIINIPESSTRRLMHVYHSPNNPESPQRFLAWAWANNKIWVFGLVRFIFIFSLQFGLFVFLTDKIAYSFFTISLAGSTFNTINSLLDKRGILDYFNSDYYFHLDEDHVSNLPDWFIMIGAICGFIIMIFYFILVMVRERYENEFINFLYIYRIKGEKPPRPKLAWYEFSGKYRKIFKNIKKQKVIL